MTTLRLANCTIAITPGSVETTLPSGKRVMGMPHHTPSYRKTARDHGYGTDVERLNRTHEVTHTLLAHILGLPVCPVFERVGNGQHEPTEITQAAEGAILALERYANMLGVDLVSVAQRWSEV